MCRCATSSHVIQLQAASSVCKYYLYLCNSIQIKVPKPKFVSQESHGECIFIMDLCAIDAYTGIIQILVEHPVYIIWYCLVVVCIMHNPNNITKLLQYFSFSGSAW